MQMHLFASHFLQSQLESPPSPNCSWDTSRWAASEFAALLLVDDLPKAPLQAAFCLRTLQSPPPPSTVHYYNCDYCASPVGAPWQHVAPHCPVFLCQWAFVLLLASVTADPDTFLLTSNASVSPSNNTALAIRPTPKR